MPSIQHDPNAAGKLAKAAANRPHHGLAVPQPGNRHRACPRNVKALATMPV